MATPLKHRSSLSIIENWIRTHRKVIIEGDLTYADKRIVERECSLLEDMAIAILAELDAAMQPDVDEIAAINSLRERLRKMVGRASGAYRATRSSRYRSVCRPDWIRHGPNSSPERMDR